MAELMAELIPLGDLPTFPSSIDPVYTGPSAPLAITAPSIRALLRRTKSTSHQIVSQKFPTTTTASQVYDDDRLPRGRTRSLVRANSKRRRSVAPPSRTSTQSRESSQRSPSRGRTRRRDATACLGSPRREKTRQYDKGSHVFRPQQQTQSRSPPSGQAEHSSLPHADRPIKDVSSYITKGAFRLYNYREPELFRFPKSRSQPEHYWQAGDGFSGDEATPGLVLPMTSKHKRKRSRSLSAFGQLSLETENTVGNNVGWVASSQSRLMRLHGPREKAFSAEVNELWPTRENFAESTIAQRRRNIAVENHNRTTPANSEPGALSNVNVKKAIPLKRMPSGFENLGKRKRRSRSFYGRTPSSSFMRVSPECQDQAGDNKYDEEGNGPYEGMGDESDQESILEYTHTPPNLESSDGGSEKSSEENPDDLDQDMQDMVQDSAPDEVPSSSPDLSQGRNRAGPTINIAR
ncbi:hypothetical protein F4859DRAFT_518668 [Xylaria cf. heliscus]|nr:hypothetical protein F4859DRAFT_518668 [Xylaria cf. heliscus]